MFQIRILRPTFVLSTFILLLFTALSPAAAFGQLGSEFPVNTTTTRSQVLPSIAMHTDGSFVVVWQSDQLGASNWDIYGQRYDATGNELGGEFPVNTNVDTFTQQEPTIDMDASGNFVIAWAGSSTGATNEIYARIYDADGTPQGDQILVSTTASANQVYPYIAVDAEGDFVVSWEYSPIPGQPSDVYARRFNAAGIAQGAEFRVNTNASGGQANGRVAMDPVGNFVVAWDSTLGSTIWAKRFDAAGVAQGDEFMVAAVTANGKILPSIGIDDNGNFVITWTQTGTTTSQYAQRYDANGVALGSEFQVSASRGFGWITMNSSGRFVIVTAGGGQVWARRFDPDGTPQGSEFQISTTSPAESAQVGIDSYGNFAAAWMKSASDIFASRFGEPPALSVSPLTLTFFSEEGEGLTPAQIVTISNSAVNGSALTIDVDTLPDWLICTDPSTPTLTSGASTTISCRADPGILTPQTYNGSFDIVSFTSGVIGTPQTVNVAFTISSGPIVTVITENEFYTAFEQQRANYPAIASGIADFVPDGIDMTLSLSTGEVGIINFLVIESNSFLVIRIYYVENLEGNPVSQNYLNVINRDLAPLITATLDSILVTRFGSTQNVEGVFLDNNTMTLSLNGS
jgi:hypothetical protein